MKNIHFILLTLFWVVTLVVTHVVYRNAIATYQEALTNLRADAKRTNDELICLRIIFANFNLTDDMIADCEKAGVYLEKPRTSGTAEKRVFLEPMPEGCTDDYCVENCRWNNGIETCDLIPAI